MVTYESICLSTYVYIYLCLATCFSLCLSVCLHICLSLCLSVCLPMYVCLHMCVSLYVSVCLSTSVFVCLCIFSSLPLPTHHPYFQDISFDLPQVATTSAAFSAALSGGYDGALVYKASSPDEGLCVCVLASVMSSVQSSLYLFIYLFIFFLQPLSHFFLPPFCFPFLLFLLTSM
jgi:hypothetical protein